MMVGRGAWLVGPPLESSASTVTWLDEVLPKLKSARDLSQARAFLQRLQTGVLAMLPVESHALLIERIEHMKEVRSSIADIPLDFWRRLVPLFGKTSAEVFIHGANFVHADETANILEPWLGQNQVSSNKNP